ncbi:hypothetical protein GGX14DRAFT_567704 [Mycena pura]|uniref:Amine oxidase domain-containing protein n=1 Tax=Mycena pura TaxID=153505 RepID=A0AAD6V9Z9_9AGAR|nr:hypothetical protein GGX14DRAFT_567704 [Mycena pura]
MSPLSPSNPSVGDDIYAQYGRLVVTQYLQEHKPVSRGPGASVKFARALPEEPVGILGAGGAGLYTALILDDLGIPFKVIEARDRVGGRLYTHTFPNQTGAPYNYFDVGAMRFPQTDSMSRVFHLFGYAPLNRDGLALKSRLKPFHFVGAGNNNTLLSYTGVTVRQNAAPTASDPFKSELVIKDADPRPYVAAGAKAIVDDVIRPFAEALLQDMKDKTKKGWEKLLRYDRHSTRAYMTTQYIPSDDLNIPKTSLPVDVVNWLETFDMSTGWYDRAFTETVLEAVAFGWDPSSDPLVRTPWFCIDGGAFQIGDTVHQYLKKRNPNAFIFKKRVTGITTAKNAQGDTIMSVTTDFDDEARFSHVITTIPLPVMRTIDLSGAGLSPMQSSAIRMLNYGPSVKIGMQFRTAWWTTANDNQGQPLNIIGGQTYTDTPLRTVVYPSFGNIKAGKTTTLIASYCWTEDAERLASLITNDKKVLVEMVLRELATIHNVTVQFLRDELIDTFAWSWSQDPYSMGSSAFFGPGKFANLFTSLSGPAAGGRLHFAGEAISVRHAWLEGAFDSAWRAVHDLLTQPGYNDYLVKFFTNWGTNAEWFDVPNPEVKPGGGRRGPGAPDTTQPNDIEEILKHSLLLPLIEANQPDL